MQEAPVYIFAALPCEAKPLIAYFKLKKETSISPFAIYRRDSLTLTVSGVGKSAMAAAVAYTSALFPANSLAVMLNIGVAGHKSHELGALFAAEKITDQDSNKSYYPQLVVNLPCLTQGITTVSQPQLHYKTESLYDMEASAFYEAAIRFSSSELIQSLKVISDNENNEIEQITPAKVSVWLEKQLNVIDTCIKKLQALANEHKVLELNEYPEIIQQWRLSSNERLQLKRLLSRWEVLSNGKALDLKRQQDLTGKQFLVYLQKRISEQGFGGFNLVDSK
jgi:nucleoside phosphorylase